MNQSGQTLTVDASVSAGVDKLKTFDAAGVTLFARDGQAAVGNGSINYALYNQYVTARVFGAATGRHFTGAGVDRNEMTSYGGASVNLALPITARTLFSAQAGASYQPASASVLFPDLFRTDGPPPLPTEFDLASPLRAFVATDLSASLARQLSRTSAASVGFNQRLRGSVSEDSTERIDSAYVAYGRGLTRWLSLRLGYQYTERKSTGGSVAPDGTAIVPVKYHAGDFGVDFNRALSVSRRTTLGFSTGTIGTSDGNRTHVEVVGDARLSHGIGRTWKSGLTYSRDLNFVQTFSLPTFSDSLTANVEGQPLSRLLVSGGSGLSFGRVGLVNSSNRYRAWQSALGATFNLTRLLSLRLDYAYYRYRFDSEAFLPMGVGARVHRHHFQIGTGVNVPLLGRSGRTNAAR